MLVLATSGCAVGPDYHPATPVVLGVPGGYSVPASSAAPEDIATWWNRFDDPLLTRIVEQARAGNLDIAQSVARLRQAREALVQSRAALLPTLTASGTYSRAISVRGGRTTTLADGTIIQTGNAGDSFSLGPDVSYQADIFGGVRRGIESSRAQYEASGYDLASVQIATEGEAARNYMLARLYQAQLGNARESLHIQDDNLEIVGFRVQAGLVSSLDREQARTQRATTAATIPAIEQNYNAAVSRLGVLTGQAPGSLKADLEAVRPIPQGPATIAVGIPADTLRQRPDVRAAERSLASASAQIGVAEARLYPALQIGGSLSTNATRIGSLFDIISGTVFASVSQTLFDGGRLRAQVRASRAATDGAFAAYKSTILTGLEDVETAIVALDAAERRGAEYATAYDAANNFAILSRSQYRAGLTDFTTLNTAETSLLSSRNSLAQARADQAQALVQLYLALGGGWNPAADPTSLPQEAR